MGISRSTVIRWGKWSLAGLAGVVTLLALTVLVITAVVDPNRYRGKVETIVGDLAGRRLVIEGGLKITWFPWLGVRIGAAHFEERAAAVGSSAAGTSSTAGGSSAPEASSTPGTSATPVAGAAPLEWQSASVAAKLLPLLRGQVIVDRVRFEKPHLRLRRDASGHGNWEDLGPARLSASPQQANTAPPEVAGIDITDGEVDYLDEGTHLHFNLANWQLHTSEWRPGIAVDVHTRFVARGDSITPDGVPVQIDAPKLTTQLSPAGVTTPKLTLQVADARIEGPLTIAAGQTGDVVASGSLTIQAPAVRRLATCFNLEQYLPKDPTTLGKLDSSGTWSYKDSALSVTNLNITLDGTRFQGWLTHSAPPQAAWRFELHGDQIDLGRYTDINTSTHRSFEERVRALKAFNANGTLRFDQVQLADTHMTDVALQFESPEQHQ